MKFVPAVAGQSAQTSLGPPVPQTLILVPV